MKDLDEAIKHCHEKAEELVKEREKWLDCENDDIYRLRKAHDCNACAKEHEQLAKWLEELKKWHTRVEESKNGGTATIIVNERVRSLTKGHIEALIEYEQQKMIEDAIDRIMNGGSL